MGNVVMQYSHRNCSHILPGRALPEAEDQWLRERTHGCWCSSWKEIEGRLHIWRDGEWQKPKRGELRNCKLPETVERKRNADN